MIKIRNKHNWHEWNRERERKQNNVRTKIKTNQIMQTNQHKYIPNEIKKGGNTNKCHLRLLCSTIGVCVCVFMMLFCRDNILLQICSIRFGCRCLRASLICCRAMDEDVTYWYGQLPIRSFLVCKIAIWIFFLFLPKWQLPTVREFCHFLCPPLAFLCVLLSSLMLLCMAVRCAANCFISSYVAWTQRQQHILWILPKQKVPYDR